MRDKMTWSEQLWKLKDKTKGMTGVRGFFDEYRYLSNFQSSEVILDGITYPTVENAYQAAKTLDLEERKPFVLFTPVEAKKAGMKVKLREDWEQVKLLVMEDLVRQKFSKDPLKDRLLSTGSEYLEETNWWKDTYWGVCNGVGENILGQILMRVRDSLR